MAVTLLLRRPRGASEIVSSGLDLDLGLPSVGVRSPRTTLGASTVAGGGSRRKEKMRVTFRCNVASSSLHQVRNPRCKTIVGTGERIEMGVWLSIRKEAASGRIERVRIMPIDVVPPSLSQLPSGEISDLFNNSSDCLSSPAFRVRKQKATPEYTVLVLMELATP